MLFNQIDWCYKKWHEGNSVYGFNRLTKNEVKKYLTKNNNINMKGHYYTNLSLKSLNKKVLFNNFVDKKLQTGKETDVILFLEVKLHLDEWSKNTEPYWEFNIVESKYYLEQILGNYNTQISGWTGWKIK